MAFSSSQTRWQPPEGLDFPSPRPVRLTGQGIGIVVVAVLMLLGAALIGPIVSRDIAFQMEKARQLREQGSEATGTVTRVWQRSDKSRTRMVAYQFTAPGGEFTGESKMNDDVWRATFPGDSLTIRYLPSQPRTNAPAKGVPGPPPVWTAWLPLCGFLAPAIIFVFMIRSQWRLLSEGVPTPGTVTGIRRSKKYYIAYEFKIPSGELLKGNSGSSGRNLPQVGAQVCILYNPDRPRRNSLYPLELVKLQPRGW